MNMTLLIVRLCSFQPFYFWCSCLSSVNHLFYRARRERGSWRRERFAEMVDSLPFMPQFRDVYTALNNEIVRLWGNPYREIELDDWWYCVEWRKARRAAMEVTRAQVCEVLKRLVPDIYDMFLRTIEFIETLEEPDEGNFVFQRLFIDWASASSLSVIVLWVGCQISAVRSKTDTMEQDDERDLIHTAQYSCIAV